MLLDYIEPDPNMRERMVGALQQRSFYLTERASAIAERSGDAESMEARIVLATLYLECAEALAAIDALEAAGAQIRNASEHLIHAGLPLGAALRLAFGGPVNDPLGAVDLLFRWKSAADEKASGKNAERDWPQQLGYYVIGSRFTGGGRPRAR